MTLDVNTQTDAAGPDDGVGRPAIAWRLGLDLGTNSLGWVALELKLDDKGIYQPCGVLAIGSRIFSSGANGAGRDPKSGASLAVDRRDARSMRRRRDRFQQRQRALIKYLIRDGLFPADPEERRKLALLDPYELRARALDEALTPGEIARAIFHLNQRRGFQSNRKADRGKKDAETETGKVKGGIDRLKDQIADREAELGDEPRSWTFGKWLYDRRTSAIDQNAIPAVRTRVHAAPIDDKNDVYDFYPGRDLIAEEFDRILEAQSAWHPDLLNPAVCARLHEIVFHQRPLKAPKIGKCTLVDGEERLPKAHPLFQQRRLLEELNGLTIVRSGENPERLSPAQRDLLLSKLRTSKSMPFTSMRKALKLDPAARFGKESENRKDLKGDEVAATMASKTRFGSRWVTMPIDEQWEIVDRVDAVQSDAEFARLCDWLRATYALDDKQAIAIAKAPLPQGFGRFGPTATTGLIEALTTARTPAGRKAKDGPIEAGRVVVYSEAVAVAGLRHHSDFRTGEVFTDAQGRPALPYYGVALERHIMPGTANPEDPEEMRIGRLTNPTVHIGLNQLRDVVNRLIRAYGLPAQIALELARELKLSQEETAKRNQENARNKAEAEKRSAKLHEASQDDSGANRARLKLWEELNPGNALDRRCIYSGVQISIKMLFSSAVEIDHILPFSTTWDDSNANKIVCIKEANREKGKRSPYGAWGTTDRWDEIAERASRLPRNKRWRFEPDAMAHWDDAEKGFLARQLVDTQYLGRLARDYLVTLYPGSGEGSSHVWVSPGRLTELVRRKLGLNSLLPDHNFGAGKQPKNRLDHRHHAIDAAVIAVVDRSLLAGIAKLSGQGASDEEMRIRVPEPWPGFRDDLSRAVNAITVAHRADHGTVSKAGLAPGKDQTAARLHNETALGFTRLKDRKGTPLVVHRIPLAALKPEHLIENGKPPKPAWVADADLRRALADATGDRTGRNFLEAVNRFAKADHIWSGLRRVRILEPTAVIPIRDAKGHAYKGYKGDSNYRYDVWELPYGKWRAQVVSMFDAHQGTDDVRPHPAARKVLSLQRDDMLAIERGGVRELVRVVKFSDNQFTVAPPQEAGSLKARDADPDDPFKYLYPSPNTLKAWRARQVRVDQLGRVMDPGFPARKTVRATRPRPPSAG